MKKRIILILIFILLLTSCKEEKIDDGKINIIASFYPIGDFTERIGKDKVNVKLLIKDGNDPHNWEMTTKERNDLEKADLFIYNHKDFETWTKDVIPNLENEKLLILESAENIDISKFNDNPHTWISLKNAIIQMENIKDILIKKDPENAKYYEENFENEKNAFEEVNENAKKEFSKLDRNIFITGHDSFVFLADDYDLEVFSIESVASQGEPDPKTMANLVELAKENEVNTIFYDSLFSDKTAKIIAEEIGGEYKPLNPLEGLTEEEKSNNMDFLSVMEVNINLILESLRD